MGHGFQVRPGVDLDYVADGIGLFLLCLHLNEQGTVMTYTQGQRLSAMLMSLKANTVFRKVLEAAGYSEEEIKKLYSDEEDIDTERLESFLMERINPDKLLSPVGATYGERVENFRLDVGAETFALIAQNPEFTNILADWRKQTSEDNGKALIRAFMDEASLSFEEAQAFVASITGQLDEIIGD